MATAVMMPQVGQDIKTATIVKWHKKENDMVNKGDVVATVESDKATFDVEAYDSGVLLKRLYEEGQEVKVLTPIAYLGQAGESVSEEPSTTARGSLKACPEQSRRGEGFGDAFSDIDHPQPVRQAQGSAAFEAATQPVRPKEQLKMKASPSARRLAKEKGVDLKNVKGTGPGGRITTEDVLKAFDKTDAGGPD